MISSRVGCVWNGCERNGSIFARTIRSSLFGTTSLRHSHSSSVHGERKSTFSAAVTKRRVGRSGIGLLIRFWLGGGSKIRSESGSGRKKVGILQSWKQLHQRIGKQFHPARIGMINRIQHHGRVRDALPPKPAVSQRGVGESDIRSEERRV